jgi:hypothetical protein
MRNLLPVHVASAEGTDEGVLILPAKGKHNQQTASVIGAPDSLETLLRSGVQRIGEDGERSVKQAFDRRKRNAVPLALVPITLVPVEGGKPQSHRL